MEDIVTQYHTGSVVPDELPADDEGLGETVRGRLLRIGELHPEIRTVPEQPLETRKVVGRGDDEDIPDARQQKHGHRIVDHRLVINRQELLGHSLRDRIQAGATAAGENDSFHNS